MFPSTPFDITAQLGLLTYIIDVYLFVSASALAATVVVRSIFGGGFPVGVIILPSLCATMLTTSQVIWISNVRKTRTTMGVLSRRLYRPCINTRTIYLDKIRAHNPS